MNPIAEVDARSRGQSGRSGAATAGVPYTDSTGFAWRPFLVVLVLGLVVTAALAVVTATVNNRNEDRLLSVQVREAGTVLAGAIPTVETPLASGAAIAGVTPGESTPFEQFMAAYVGTGGRPFAYVALCAIENGTPVVLASIGSPSVDTAHRGASQCSFASGSDVEHALSVKGIVDGGRRLGFAYLSPAPGARLGVYAETPLPPNHRAVIPRSSAFANLNFALYLGPSGRSSDLLETTVPLPITGRQSATTVRFADTSLTLVGTPSQPLGGALSRDLTAVVLVFGLALSLGAALMAERVVRRRRSAEGLAEENRRLYGEQQSLSSSLQRALLPTVLPDISGVEIATRYEAGVEVMDIGGDWFDLITCPDEGFIFVVGDVSGRGVSAAVVMASLHYAIRAYAADGDQPDVILSKLCSLLDVTRDGHFATVLCGYVDLERRKLTLSSAGHFPPLIVTGRNGAFVDMAIGPPIGTADHVTYPSVTVEVPPGSTVLAFTDGLIERRGAVLDVGLERLRAVATRQSQAPAPLIDELVAELTPDGTDDDIAILGIQWQN